MTDEVEEKPTEERLQEAIDLYELDMENWDAPIYLDELERLYLIREQVKRIIIDMKIAIRREFNK